MAIAKVGDSEFHLSSTFYQYEVWDGTWLLTAGPLHPNEIDAEVGPATAGSDKPDLLYSDQDLLWAIHQAESLDDLETALIENRKRVPTFARDTGDAE